MKLVKKITALAVSSLMMFSIAGMNVFAASTTQDGIEVSLTTDKEAYSKNEKITATLSVKNTNAKEVADVAMETVVPDGYKVDNESSATKNIETLSPNETVDLKVVLIADVSQNSEVSQDSQVSQNSEVSQDSQVSQNSEVSQDNQVSQNSEVSQDSQVSTVKPNDNTINTGDDPSIAFFIAIVLVVSVLITIVCLKNKQGRKLLSVLLTVSLLSSSAITFSIKTNALEDNTVDKSIELVETISLDGSSLSISAKVTYSLEKNPDTDKDGVSDIMEALLGTDPTKDDTDGDRLSDNFEILYSGTDPILADTDGNGISDYDEDGDGDGLTNGEEYQLNTRPDIIDTDNDKINDFDEVKKYKTDPLKPDTDGDTISDYEEIQLGLDPLNPSTDGKVNDAQRKFNQQTDNTVKDEGLIHSENWLVPYVSGNVSGLITEHIAITSSKTNSLDENRSVLSDVIEVKTSYEEPVSLNFKCNQAYSGEVKNLAVVLIDGANISPLETEYNGDNITASISKSGTYCVVDVDEFLKSLGIDVVKNVKKTTSSSASAKTSSNAQGKADIVFVVDTTGSMSDSINNVKNNINTFAETLTSEYSVNANFALIEYRDIVEDGVDTTIQHKNMTTNWYTNVNTFKNAIGSLSVDGGGDTAETPIDALKMAYDSDWRSDSVKFVIIVTDAGYKLNNSYGIESMNEMADLFKNANIIVSAISYSEDAYNDLTSATDGIYGYIYSNFSTVLLTLAEKIGSATNENGDWVILNDLQTIQISGEIDDIATLDSDNDGLSDADELGVKTELELRKFIEFILSHNDISPDAYSGKDTIEVWNYKSNPVLPDTDFDGIGDKDDKLPLDGVFNGEFLGYKNIKNAAYTMNFRDFLNNSSTYSNDLCSASLNFANTIYSDCGFTYGPENDYDTITDIVQLMKLHGFKKIMNYKLAEGYNGDIQVSPYKDDDISEICIGYHDIISKKQTKRVIGVIIRGTNGTIEEWSSNFDMGDPSSWNSEYHKGFYTTEERIRSFVNKYVGLLDNTDNLVYWITGHSRGAALSNILAAKLIDDGNIVFAYTFATPSTTIRSDMHDERYNSIYNFANTSDFVTYVPLSQWGFGRFGITKESSIEDWGLESVWCEKTGAEKYKALNKSVITIATNRITNSCSKNWGEVHSRAGSQDITDKQYNCISERAKRYCDIVEDKNIFGKHKGYKLYPSTAFVFQLGAECLAGTEQEKNNAITIIKELWNSKYSCMIVLLMGELANTKADYSSVLFTPDISYSYRLIGEFFSGFGKTIGEFASAGEALIGDGHAPATYYVLTHYEKTTSHGGSGGGFR